MTTVALVRVTLGLGLVSWTVRLSAGDPSHWPSSVMERETHPPLWSAENGPRDRDNVS